MSLRPSGEASFPAGPPYWDEGIETLPRDALRQLQLGRLQWQVRRCWKGSEFYRRRLHAEWLYHDRHIAVLKLPKDRSQ